MGARHRYTSEPDGWSTTNQMVFVSSYAHKKNSTEDMPYVLRIGVALIVP